MSDSGTDTIAAIATPLGEGGISIVRVSGPGSLAIADQLITAQGSLPSTRTGGSFLRGTIRVDGVLIDEVVALIMRAPHSYTREDVVEFQGHGGVLAARRLLRAVLEAGARAADPGEFTKRAFLNGRLDLVQAEAVLDLIRAQSDRAASAAIEQLEGSLSRSINALYDKIVSACSDLEASLDFSEDEIQNNLHIVVLERLMMSLDQIDGLISTWDEGHLLRDGALVVIYGKPNVGKSTLFNAILGRDRAITSEIPGTTRDIIEESLVLDGIPLRIADTAGLRASTCVIEKEGIRRAIDHIEKADIQIYILDATQEPTAEELAAIHQMDPRKSIVALNKSDLALQGLKCKPIPVEYTVISISAKENQGLDILKAALIKILGISVSGHHQAVISERHRNILERAKVEVEAAVELLENGRDDGIVLCASHLRQAAEQVGTMTGRIYHRELLEAVFSRFCVGK